MIKILVFTEGTVLMPSIAKDNDNYQDVAEKLMPDILIEDDCESIGGEAEMTYPHIKPELQQKIKSIVVKEFGGIDHLPDSINAVPVAKLNRFYKNLDSIVGI